MKKWGMMTDRSCTVCGVKRLDIWFTDKKDNIQCSKCYLLDGKIKNK